MTDIENEDFDVLRTAIESCTNPNDFSNNGLPKTLSFRIEQSTEAPHLSHAVHFTLTTYYPLRSCLVRIEWSQGKRSDNSYLSATIQQYAQSLAGDESGMQLVKVAPSRISNRLSLATPTLPRCCDAERG